MSTSIRSGQFVTGFEHGSMALAQASNNASIQSTTKRTGTYALKINPSAATGYAYFPFDDAKTTNVYCGTAFYVTTKPNADCFMTCTYNTFLSDTNFGIRQKSSDGKLYASVWSQSDAAYYDSPGVDYPTGEWFHVQYFVEVSTPSGGRQNVSVRWAINGVEQTGVSPNIAQVQDASTWWGTGQSGTAGQTFTGEYYVDDVFVIAGLNDATSGLWPSFPLPDCFVTLLTPSADGTHNTSSNFTDDGASSPPSSVYDRLDEIPVNTTMGTDYIYQNAISGTSYLEVDTTITVPTDPGTGNPCAFAIAGAQRFGWQSASPYASANAQLYIYDVSNTNYLPGISINAGSSSKLWARANIDSYLGIKEEWDKATIEAYVFRTGFSSDVTDFIQIDDIHAEIAWYATASGSDHWAWAEVHKDSWQVVQ